MSSISWVTSPRQDKEVKLRMFCFPFAGGVSSYFNGWKNKVPIGVDLCPVMLPGREKLIRQPPITDINELCNLLVNELGSFLNVPYVFFGHSMGALISYELARTLREQSYRLPLHLFLSAFPAPGVIARPDPIHDLDDSAFKEAIASFNGTPREVLEDDALMSVILPYLRADFKMIETYIYRHLTPLPIPFSVYGGDRDYISRADLLKWKFHTSSSCQMHTFSGGHFYLSDSAAMHKVMDGELMRLITQVDQHNELKNSGSVIKAGAIF